MDNEIGVVLSRGKKVNNFHFIIIVIGIICLVIFAMFSSFGLQKEAGSFTDKHAGVVAYVLCVIISNRIAKLIHRIYTICEQYYFIKRIYQEDSITCVKYLCYDFITMENAIIFILSLYYKTIVHTNIYFIVFNCAPFYVFYHFRALSDAEVNEVLEKNFLSVGYGLAYFYYHNYLYNIMSSFLQRVHEFSLLQNVLVQKQLFILVPKSCIIERYIDENYDRVQWTRELPFFATDVAGIKKRIFNVTVYEIFSKNKEKSIRCAIEYAQPLRHLNEVEMNESWVEIERLRFIENLKIFLHDNQNSHKTICLIDYDDKSENCNIADLILDACTFINNKSS